MKKILFTSLNDHVPWGGSEVLWSETAKNLSLKYDIKALVKKWDAIPKPIENLEANGISICYKPIKIVPVPFKEQLVEKIKYKIGFKKKKDKCDLVVVSDLNSFEVVIISLGDHADSNLYKYAQYLKDKCIPYVIIVQLTTMLKYLPDFKITQLKEAYTNAKAVCYLSDENLEAIEVQLAVRLSNVMKIDNPFNYNQVYIPVLPKKVYHIACVAALNSFHKGQELLFKVLSQEKWKQRNICFNFYGTGVSENHFKNLIALYKIEDIVQLKGYESDKNKIWRNNIACIMPSRMEGQSLAMLEAMSFGRMVISTKVGDAQRLIKQDETGFLIDAPTVELIDLTLERAWEYRRDWEQMGKLSRVHLYDVIKRDPVIDLSEKLEKLLN